MDLNDFIFIKRKANQLESQKEDHKGDSHSLLNK